ncbi:hypothetical protein TWF281_007470 [Arthrobotrys megalospora]
MSTILSLPSELLLEVASYLSQSDKAHLSQTSHNLHEVVASALYRNLTIEMYYHPSTANETNYLSITPSRDSGRRIHSPLHALAKYGAHVRTLTLRVSRMPEGWSKTQARRCRVSVRWIKSAILKCTGTTKLQLLSGSTMDSESLPKTIYQPYELFYTLTGIAQCIMLSFKYLKEVVISSLSDVDSFKGRAIVLDGPCERTLSALTNIRVKTTGKTLEDMELLRCQICDVFDGVKTTIHSGNLDPASRRYRIAHPDLPQADGWRREVRRLNSSLEALSSTSTSNIKLEDVHSLNLLSFPMDGRSYAEAVPRISKFRELRELWIAQYQPGPDSLIPWEETFPELVRSLGKLESITYRQFFRDSNGQHKNEWRMVEKRYKVDHIDGIAAKYGSTRDEFYRIWEYN